MLDHAGFFRIFWEHSRRAPGRRARGPATTPDFRPFCARGLSQRCRLRQDGTARRAARSPRADAAAIRAPPTGGTAAIAPKAAPKSAAYKDTPPLQGPAHRRARDTGGYQQKTSSARAYSSAATAPQHLIASAAMPVRRGAAGHASTTTHTTCAPHAQLEGTATPRVAERRRRGGCCKPALGVVAPAPASAFA